MASDSHQQGEALKAKRSTLKRRLTLQSRKISNAIEFSDNDQLQDLYNSFEELYLDFTEVHDSYSELVCSDSALTS